MSSHPVNVGKSADLLGEWNGRQKCRPIYNTDQGLSLKVPQYMRIKRHRGRLDRTDACGATARSYAEAQ